MNIFGGLDAEAYDRSYSDLELIKRLSSYFAPYRRRMLVIAAMITIISVAGAWQTLIIAQGVDVLDRNPTTPLLLGLIAVVFITGVGNWAANWVRRRLTSRAIGDVVLQLRSNAFRAAAEHDLSFYDEFKSGRIVSRITSDTQAFGETVLLVTDLISQVIVVVILSVVLVRISIQLTWILLGFSPAVFLVALGFRRLARYVTRQGTRAMANVNSAIQEAVTGIAVAKNFRQEGAIYEEFNAINQQSYQINIRRGFVLSGVFPMLAVLAGIGTALLVYYGGLSAGQGAISVGAWYLFVSSLDRFWFPIINIAAFWSQFQAGLSAAERVFALIDAEPAVIQRASLPVGQLKGEVEFDRVCFEYSGEETVLRDFSLRVAPGENVALVGHTGAGKSSIVKLIARFYEFQEGRLLIDGQDIRSFDLRQYRKQLGIVSQVPFLFSGTVMENIRYAVPEAKLTDGEIEALARRIGGGEWLKTLPDGLQSDVGERGARLSMGQRQLVSLIRVLVQKPAIFILDEATASVDPFTETQIQEALELILAETTSIMIAHRLSTVRNADRILVLRRGEIIEEGDHQDLLFQGGHYAELYNTYFRHQSLEYIEQAREMALA